MSRMKGNFHVRFFEGSGLATARSHSASEIFSRLRHSSHCTFTLNTRRHFVINQEDGCCFNIKLSQVAANEAFCRSAAFVCGLRPSAFGRLLCVHLAGSSEQQAIVRSQLASRRNRAVHDARRVGDQAVRALPLEGWCHEPGSGAMSGLARLNPRQHSADGSQPFGSVRIRGSAALAPATDAEPGAIAWAPFS